MKLTWDTAKPGVRVKIISPNEDAKHFDSIGTIQAIEQSEAYGDQTIWVKFDKCRPACHANFQCTRLNACNGYYTPETFEIVDVDTAGTHECTCDFDIVMNRGCQCNGV